MHGKCVTYTPFTRYSRLSNRQPAVSCKQTSNRLSNRLSNGFDNRFDNRFERTATVRSTGCQTALYNRFDNRVERIDCSFNTVVKRSTRLSNRLYNPVLQPAVYTIQPFVKATSFEPDSVMEFGFEPVCDQLRSGSSYLDTTC